MKAIDHINVMRQHLDALECVEAEIQAHTALRTSLWEMEQEVVTLVENFRHILRPEAPPEVSDIDALVNPRTTEVYVMSYHAERGASGFDWREDFSEARELLAASLLRAASTGEATYWLHKVTVPAHGNSEVTDWIEDNYDDLQVNVTPIVSFKVIA